MTASLKENILKFKKNGLLPAFVKGKPKWRVTYATGETKILFTVGKVKEAVRNEGIVKVEKKTIVGVLKGSTKKDIAEQDKTDWYDVTSRYL